MDIRPCNERVDGARLIETICVDVTKGEGDGEKIPYHREYQFYLKDGTFIGEIAPATQSIF